MSHQALILAGGRATRMGGADKGLVALSGRPLLAHALSALSAQLPAPARVWISANRNLEVYAGFGRLLLQDPLPDFPGPLAGVLAALQRDDGAVWLVMPCDAVRPPADFASLAGGAGGWPSGGQRARPRRLAPQPAGAGARPQRRTGRLPGRRRPLHPRLAGRPGSCRSRVRLRFSQSQHSRRAGGVAAQPRAD